ncbi:ABC transporter ATP-binding protein/permease [Brevibacterium sp. p3-SID960]|uniref:ABC transporter ATP-binding protein n=1 Tax=Brevibacterium sp. p3-SID960 TaxID=2916063 RepID=UPI0021A6C8CF|nr:ABC transporter ATP-binding protein [Brevibacterium sp. p3-SID960]MCT1690547.1 ABC transporter ATP-binding protein/permease [Brevibacterium sp. p3-SID960]
MLLTLLKRYLRPYTGALAIVLIFEFVQSLAALYLPTLNAHIVDRGVAQADVPLIWRLGGLMLLVSFVQLVAMIIAVYFGARTAMRAGRDLRRDVFHTGQSFSQHEVARFGAATLITRNTNDVQQVQMLILMSCTMLVMAPMMALGGIIMALSQDLRLSWLILVAVPLLLVALGILIARMIPQFKVMQTRIDTINAVAREQLTGIRVIRAFAREATERGRFDIANRQLTETNFRVGMLFALMFPLVMGILNVSSVAVVWFGGLQVEAGITEVGTMMAFMQYLMQILMGVMMATFMTMMIPRAAVSAKRIGEVLATAPTVTPPADPVPEVEVPGAVALTSATFGFPGAEAPVLRGVTAAFQPGTTTAIIGSTGAGKSTLLGLIPRLFDVQSGTVEVGGVDVRRLDPAVLHAQIGLVPQKAFLFSGTVASNLRYGNPEATDDELWQALEVAQAAGFVAEMPGGLEARIAQGGQNVSGGQRQRLAIARALVANPPVLLFDDSFSALDTETDARLRAALDEHYGHATRIIVAQRIASITDADQIIVLDDGAIVGTGTHDELASGNEVYREIVESQRSVGSAL